MDFTEILENRLVEYFVGTRCNTTASELFYDLLATTGMMILGVRKRCVCSDSSYVYLMLFGKE